MKTDSTTRISYSAPLPYVNARPEASATVILHIIKINKNSFMHQYLKDKSAYNLVTRALGFLGMIRYRTLRRDQKSS